MIVIDASALLEFLFNSQPGKRVAARLAGQTLHAPEIIDLEVLQVLRRLCATRELAPERANQVRGHLGSTRLHRCSHAVLTERIWTLRANLTAYDAAYVALAERLSAPLVTLDRKLVGRFHAATVECL